MTMVQHELLNVRTVEDIKQVLKQSLTKINKEDILESLAYISDIASEAIDKIQKIEEFEYDPPANKYNQVEFSLDSTLGYLKIAIDEEDLYQICLNLHRCRLSADGTYDCMINNKKY